MLGLQTKTLAWLVTRLLATHPLATRSKPFLKAQAWSHLAMVGADSLGIVTVIAACAGVILALQAAMQLEKVGATSYVANLVGVTLIRELGPLLTAITITGRVGAAYTAEIATMQISQELDALEVMGLDPVRFIVWPKLQAMLVMLPVLTLWADVVGIIAGWMFSALYLELSSLTYLEQTVTFLKLRDVIAGMTKSVGFGAAIAIICCWQGFLAREGALDVGSRTTSAVVLSILAIILLDLLFTIMTFTFR